ncbi:hypothetical protein L2E82_09979 [Cichorium intybus]|uniref:Uncharacterized protein n=1 Tax=Cichorium intybus TaxID=13427 RepID=A0ACB9G9L8_CICIN|nr:hypothetical protein L2E82_09979 [Cichorium intybus]
MAAMLKIKSNQNMVINLDSSLYSEGIRPMIECLKHSRISQALTASAYVPIPHLSAAYSTASYNRQDESVTFELATVKPLSRSQSGLRFHSVESISYKHQETEISCARFWSIVVHWAITTKELRIMTDSVMGIIPILPTASFVTTKVDDFDFIRTIPVEMTNRVPSTVECVAEYCKLEPSGVRPLDKKHKEAFEKLENPKKVSKRKGKGSTSETDKLVKRPRRLRKIVLSTHSEQHTVSNLVQGTLGPNEDEEDIGNTGLKPLSPTHNPTPKTTPHSSPKPTPNNSPIQNTNTQKSPSPSPKQTTIPSPNQQNPLSEEEEEDVPVYDDLDDLADFIESPFNVRFNVSNDNAPMTKEEFTELSAKLDLLLQANKSPSTSDWQS